MGIFGRKEEPAPHEGRYFVEVIKHKGFSNAEAGAAILQEALDRAEEKGWEPLHFVGGGMAGAASFPVAVVWDTRPGG